MGLNVRLLVRPLMITIALACVPASAYAADLFVVATPSQREAAADARPGRRGETRSRLVALAADALPPTDALPRADAAARPGAGRGLRIRLFPDADATFEPTGEENAFGGARIWRGRASGEDRATLVMSNGSVTGRVTLKGRLYRIESAGNGLARVAELKRMLLPPSGPEVEPKGLERDSDAADPAAEARAADAAAADASITEVRVLFAYTKRARAASKDILSEINLSVALSNEAYEASGVRIRMKLAGAIRVKGYNENARSYDETLDDLTNQIGPGAPFKAIGVRRDKSGADLVTLIREGGDYCGLGWAIDKPKRSTADYGYSEVSRDCIEYDTVAHETGHNMGLHHDRYVEGPAPKSAYHFGYVNLGVRVRDVMSYSDKCDVKGVDCRQVTMFSTPDKKVENKPFGVPKGKKGAADAARRLNETRKAIASYRPDASGDKREEAADVAAALRETD